VISTERVARRLVDPNCQGLLELAARAGTGGAGEMAPQPELVDHGRRLTNARVAHRGRRQRAAAGVAQQPQHAIMLGVDRGLAGTTRRISLMSGTPPSITPACTRPSISPLCALRPWPLFALRTSLTTDRALGLVDYRLCRPRDRAPARLPVGQPSPFGPIAAPRSGVG
jgi:hypothetical protein